MIRLGGQSLAALASYFCGKKQKERVRALDYKNFRCWKKGGPAAGIGIAASGMTVWGSLGCAGTEGAGEGSLLPELVLIYAANLLAS